MKKRHCRAKLRKQISKSNLSEKKTGEAALSGKVVNKTMFAVFF